MRKRARLSDVQALVRGEPPAGECLGDPLFERLSGAVEDLGDPDEVGPADLAALIR